MIDLDQLDFAKGDGVVTVVAQDAVSGAVLMVAYADREALERTLASGEMHYRSRTRGLWHKGATSGAVQRVASLRADCDGDTVLARVHAAGPACHEGTPTCFGSPSSDAIGTLDATIAARATAATEASYTRRLLDDRNLRLKKLGEECAELIAACADGDPGRAAAETADLFYHALVALRATGASLDDLRAEFHRRATADGTRAAVAR
jgi:phosphoribosyl-ATP pyrophosphohydrolase/phosphoribosyl-AMP cyclohydrolase